MAAELETLLFPTAADFDAWLAVHGATTPGLWLKMAKKGLVPPSINYPEAVDTALCHGWIDGQSKRVDESHFIQRFTPRRKASLWSKVNRVKVAVLIAGGKMRPAGQAEIDRAKADGRWDAAYDPPSTSTIPDDLAAAFVREPEALAFYQTLNATNRYAILHRIQTAKKAENRAARIEKFVAMLLAKEKIHL